MKTKISAITALIADGDTANAVRLLVDLASEQQEEYQRQALLIAATFNALKRAYIADPVPLTELTRINASVLDLMADMRHELEAKERLFKDGDKDRATEIEPYSVYLDFGNNHLANFMFDLAMSSYEQVLAMDPNQSDAKHGMAICHFLNIPENELNRTSNEEYLTRVEMLLRKYADCAPLRLLKATVLWGSGEYAEAIDICETLLLEQPDYYQTHIALGYYKQAMGDLNLSLFHYEKALSLNKRSAIAHNNVGYVYRLRGEMQRAIEHYDKSLRLSLSALTLMNLSDCYRFLGQFDSANHYAALILSYVEANKLPTNGFWGTDWMYNFHALEGNETIGTQTIVFGTMDEKLSLLYFNLAVQAYFADKPNIGAENLEKALRYDAFKTYRNYYKNQIQSLVEVLGVKDEAPFWSDLLQVWTKLSE